MIFDCDNCGRRSIVFPAAVGRQFRECPWCGHRMMVTSPPAPLERRRRLFPSHKEHR